MNNVIKEFLKQNKFKKINIKIEGLISSEFNIKKFKLSIDKDNIIVFDSKINVLKINKHQISKIYIEKENILEILMDQFIKISFLIENSR